LIQSTHDPGAKLNRSTHVSRISTQHGAHLLEVLQQRAALGAMFEVTFDVRSGDRIDLGVEISLHAQGFSAPHAALPRLPAAIAP
jgi:hypothetical protein